jgi:hypothetical protein
MYLLMLQQSEYIIECLPAIQEMIAAVPLEHDTVPHYIFKFAMHDIFNSYVLHLSKKLGLCRSFSRRRYC